ncbi:unnamed protein product [Pleuronectes platessa]|uniref:Uncharacterized protein n=1 Tax=Pleuronectes platessa TaxID=8262 RepID=A0A9N7YFF6_PLEPL|nr:unnamed protein product [Pleuronectes platessa]
MSDILGGLNVRSPTAERIIDCQPLSIKERQDTMAGKATGTILSDLAHPGSHLFKKHSFRRQYRSINTMITHHLHSFFPEHCHLSQPLPRVSDAKTLCIPSVPALFVLI